jgi:peptidoglycan/xylan/chitin deacetylase (PgdA/CDA1 family)
MYHHVEDLPRTVSDPYRRDLTVSTQAFRKQLELLAANGVETVSLDRLMLHFAGREPLPERAVVLSFDDGYADNYRLAFPLLQQYGMTGTFFIVPNLIGQPDYMTWEQLREMQRRQMSIESHSLDHVDLAIQPLAELRRQLDESRRALQLNLLRAVRYIAYPSGKFSPRVIAEAREVGYEAALTTDYGLLQRSTTPYELSRVRVKGADSVDSFAAKQVPAHWAYTHGRFGR